MKQYNTKQDWQDLLGKLLLPLQAHYSQQGAHLMLGASGATYEARTISMEAFARPLWGLVPLWAGGGGLSDFEKQYRRGIAAGTNPQSAEYWGDLHDYDQRMVEMAALGYALLLAPEKVWEPLSAEERKNLNNWLLQINSYNSHDNNWKFFAVLVNAGLAHVGGVYSQEAIEFGLKAIESYYIGDGWYSDGKDGCKDYYISFAIHFYSLIYAKTMRNLDSARSEVYLERARQFAQDFVYWFAEDGSAVPYGRSMTYRFAQAAFWSACVYAEAEVFPIGVLKGILLRHIGDWMDAPIFDNGGVLTIGYRYPNLNMSEFYNAPGSPYWALKTFAVLALPDEHPFWSVQPMPLPKLDAVKTLKQADMVAQRCADMVNLYPVGNFQPPGFVHMAEKYSKFVYSSRFGFSVQRSGRTLEEAAPDSMLAFEVDGYIYVRRGVTEGVLENNAIKTVWSPLRGITVRTEIILTAKGHIRRHEITSEFACRAYDCGFAVANDGEQGFEQKADGGSALARNHRESCKVDSETGSGIVFRAVPNTNLMNAMTSIPAVCYEIKEGHCEVETVITTGEYL
uniref:DUF2264 domain-containing protein n=1 Tax=uncultured Bacillota bacterium TaxID=344338 RepID=A0A650ENW1_9FIRM|nr:hypothetical protein Firmicute1046_3320 [uncultured Firmicutes bacterium]